MRLVMPPQACPRPTADDEPPAATLVRMTDTPHPTSVTPDRIIEVMQSLGPLADLRRTGYVLRGVADAETIAAHTAGVATVAMLLVDHYRAEGMTIDGERVLRMALVHDAPEAMTGDVPMPHKTPELDEALHAVEHTIVSEHLPDAWVDLWEEVEAGQTIEARIVRAADKLQMMIKVLIYEEQRRGDLSDFWANPKNYRDAGLDLVRRTYETICRRAGRPFPGL
jgi:putative hydrolase of HD superfamily